MSRKLCVALDFNNRIKNDRIKKQQFNHQVLKKDKLIKLQTKYLKNPQFIQIPVHLNCLFTGRTRAIHKQFKLGRMVLKYAITNEWITGATKYSW